MNSLSLAINRFKVASAAMTKLEDATDLDDDDLDRRLGDTIDAMDRAKSRLRWYACLAAGLDPESAIARAVAVQFGTTLGRE
jgi:hypothetical protein